MSGELISHIGIAVADLEKGTALYESILGRKVSRVVDVPDQNVRVAIFSPTGSGHPAAGGGGSIELVAAVGQNSPISRFLMKRGEGLHHVCVVVDDIERRLNVLREAGFRLIDEKPQMGADGRRIAFVHPSSTGGVLIELEERSS